MCFSAISKRQAGSPPTGFSISCVRNLSSNIRGVNFAKSGSGSSLLGVPISRVCGVASCNVAARASKSILPSVLTRLVREFPQSSLRVFCDSGSVKELSSPPLCQSNVLASVNLLKVKSHRKIFISYSFVLFTVQILPKKRKKGS